MSARHLKKPLGHTHGLRKILGTAFHAGKKNERKRSLLKASIEFRGRRYSLPEDLFALG